MAQAGAAPAPPLNHDVRNICLPTVARKEKPMLSENQRKIFADFHISVEAEGILDEKTSHMIKVAAAMALGCYP